MLNSGSSVVFEVSIRLKYVTSRSHSSTDALLTQISERTASLDGISVDELLAVKQAKFQAIADERFVWEGYGVLLYTPQECLSREMRSTFLRRALVADVSLSSAGHGFKPSERQLITLRLLRKFIVRTISTSNVEHPVSGTCATCHTSILMSRNLDTLIVPWPPVGYCFSGRAASKRYRHSSY